MMKKMRYRVPTIFLLTLLFIMAPLVASKASEDKLEWWREARFGLFIHWGLYSVPAGVWEGERITGIGEQIMRFAEISNHDYMPLAQQFNPVNFDAERVVLMAKHAGMKYIVITTKHHDGFAMFDSAVSEYDIVDATPYKKDIIKALAEACEKHGLKLGFYYSHRQDWNDPDARWGEWAGQYDTPENERTIDFNRYMKRKGLPQMKELLTQYGDVGVIWYDTACDMTQEQSQKFYNIVKKYQPDCIINGRVGNGMGDYVNLGDNEIPWKVMKEKDSEVVATMNTTWGYKSWDHEWKSATDLIETLILCTSRNANYLLNVGPDAMGNIPTPSVDTLTQVGEWMQLHGEAIHGAGPMPFLRDFPWGTTTTKDNKLYLHVFDWPENGLVFRGLKTPIKSARILTTGESVDFTQGNAKSLYEVKLNTPKRSPSEMVSVVELTLSGKPNVLEELYQFEDGSITLPAVYAKTGSSIRFGDGGETQSFNENADSLRWSFNMGEPGSYLIKLYVNRHWRQQFYKGAVVRLKFNGTSYEVELKEDVALQNVRKHSYPESICYVGEMEIQQPGKQTLEVSVVSCGTTTKRTYFDEDVDVTVKTLRLLQVELDPVQKRNLKP